MRELKFWLGLRQARSESALPLTAREYSQGGAQIGLCACTRSSPMKIYSSQAATIAASSGRGQQPHRKPEPAHCLGAQELAVRRQSACRPEGCGQHEPAAHRSTETYACFKNVLERLPTQPASTMADLLPHRCTRHLRAPASSVKMTWLDAYPAPSSLRVHAPRARTCSTCSWLNPLRALNLLETRSGSIKLALQRLSPVEYRLRNTAWSAGS